MDIQKPLYFHTLFNISICLQVISKKRRVSKYIIDNFSEEVILAEERTTEEEKMHIIEARRRAAKKKKLKKLGKSKSTDTEEEEQEDEMGDDGELDTSFQNIICVAGIFFYYWIFNLEE